jgi:membrane protein DedA with SNARE-associated domain
MNGLYVWGTALPAGALYLFIFAWLFIETTGFPISDEPLLLFAGYLTAQRRLELVAVIGLALSGKVAASCLAYWFGQRIPLERLARSETSAPAAVTSRVWRWVEALRPSKSALQLAEERFRRQGAWAVFAGRLIPVVRSFISYPAGAARMPFGVFLLATTAGSLLWISLWTALGAVAGRSYELIASRWGAWGWLIVVALALVAGGIWLWRRWRDARV